MYEAMIQGLMLTLDWHAMSLMLMTIPIGLIIGIIPGLGGNLGLALLIPFTFGMPPAVGFAFLLGIVPFLRRRPLGSGLHRFCQAFPKHDLRRHHLPAAGRLETL